MSEKDAGGDRRVGIEQIGESFFKTAANSWVNGMRVLQNRPFELDQPSPITSGNLSPQFLRNSCRSASGKAKIAYCDYVVRGARHEQPLKILRPNSSRRGSVLA